MKLAKYHLEIILFITGAMVMIFELLGSRIIAPYFGTSIFIWTSLIGVILASLSLGYYLGGKIADKKADDYHLAMILFFASSGILFVLLAQIPLLSILQVHFNIKIGTIIAGLILFAPTSLFLGMVSPYIAKLKINNLKKAGQTIGNIYAISTMGSIVGTFLAGFVLIPSLGTDKLLIVLITILSLLIISLLKKTWQQTLLYILLLIIFIIIITFFSNMHNYSTIIDKDTAYNRVRIYDITDNEGSKRFFSINNEHSSAMFLDKDDLVYEYTKYYHLLRYFRPNFKQVLMLGGAGYSYPKDFLKTYPNANIDVVEIDPQVTALAEQYFKLNLNHPRLKVYHEDGRVFLNQTANKYDAILGDAFSSYYSLPYQLTTKEAVQKKYDILNNDGIAIINIISSIAGQKGQFLRAEYATYKSIFPQVYLFPVQYPQEAYQVQNIILVALKSNEPLVFSQIADPELESWLHHLWSKEITLDMPILTDNYAPVDYYISKLSD